MFYTTKISTRALLSRLFQIHNPCNIIFKVIVWIYVLHVMCIASNLMLYINVQYNVKCLKTFFIDAPFDAFCYYSKQIDSLFVYINFILFPFNPLHHISSLTWNYRFCKTKEYNK